MQNSWDKYPKLEHIERDDQRSKAERRKRHKTVRYMAYRLKNAADQNQDLASSGDYPDNFIEYWLDQKPQYAISPTGEKMPVPPERNKTVSMLGGYSQFAMRWDIDSDLNVYARHSSVWQEWNATLLRVVPIIGE